MDFIYYRIRNKEGYLSCYTYLTGTDEGQRLYLDTEFEISRTDWEALKRKIDSEFRELEEGVVSNQDAIYWRGLLEQVIIELLTIGLTVKTADKVMKALKDEENKTKANIG